MADVTQVVEHGSELGKRKFGRNQGRKKSSKKPKVMKPPHGQKKVKINQQMKKLYNKRAREYNSDDDEDETTAPATGSTRHVASMKNRGVTSFTKNKHEEEDMESEDLSEDEGAAEGQRTQKKHVTDKKVNFAEDEEEEEDEIQPGITKFMEGCKAFKMAFKSIIKKSVSDDLLGPVLSDHKNLVIEKLAEEETERKIKGETKKEKLMLAEKGHVTPANYLDAHEKFLISVATKGVVKLFNAVNKAQVAQKGLDPSKNRDAKVIKKRTKEAFFSALGKPAIGTSAKANASTNKGEDEQPSWAPLRDNYMLTSSRIKDWDKNAPGKNESDDIEKISQDSSSDED
ncbi:putative ribosomal RNA-processing protein [Medicago truncatula]|uniref:Putative ribosomal RNA-processing protein n=1 Tax=Medicago truncatula TaxID=3880 RepID=A0A396IKZ4_MEDTR|nr:RRP15-like protein [Medicago truncatula]RHN65930.1 putative ribosomal RNA-processing protein [Medicago truncatula]